MDNIQISPLSPSRWQEAKALRLEALQQAPTAFGSSYEEEIQFEDSIWINRLTTALEQNNNLTLYAQSNGRLVGMMGANWSPRRKTGHIATVYSVYVTADMREKGIGSQLMQALLTKIQTIPQIEKVNLAVVTTAIAAIALYERFGFTKIGIAHKEIKIDGQYYDEFLMEKLLK